MRAAGSNPSTSGPVLSNRLQARGPSQPEDHHSPDGLHMFAEEEEEEEEEEGLFKANAVN